MVSGYVKVDSEGMVTVNRGLGHHTLSIEKLFQTLEFVEMLNMYIEGYPETFQNDPIGTIAMINGKVTE